MLLYVLLWSAGLKTLAHGERGQGFFKMDLKNILGDAKSMAKLPIGPLSFSDFSA